MPHRILTLLLLTGLCLSCETDEVYELPTSALNYIELDVNGQEYLLNALPARTANYFHRDGEMGELHVEYSTPDNRHSLFLQLADCALSPGHSPKTFRSDGSSTSDCQQEVTIGYTTFEMNGSAACPHLDGTPTKLTGTVTVDRWTEDGRIEGRFAADPAGEEQYVISGTFRTTLE